MTTPASGRISLSDVAAETGSNSTAAMSWVRANAKNTINGPIAGITSMNGLYSKAYYANNTAGNCANGNCTSNCNCGNKNCGNCTISGTVNCANCDGSTKFLQPNCNCACTYNCTTSTTTMNCNCDCWICACACW